MLVKGFLCRIACVEPNRKTNAMHTINSISIILIVLHLYCERVIAMEKFRIPSVPPTTNKTVRFPNDMIEKVETAIRGQQCTFSAFVIEAVRVALANLNE